MSWPQMLASCVIPFIPSSQNIAFVLAMAMLVVASTIRPVLPGLEAAAPSTRTSACHFSRQLSRLRKNRWRIASGGADDHARGWRRECRELRVEVEELQVALADARMQDEMQLLELEKLVSALADVLHERIPTEAGNVVGNDERARSETRDRHSSVKDFAIGRNPNQASDIAKVELKGVKENEAKAITTIELGSDELRANQEGLSTLRRLKHLNVHDYVHSALRASHLRSWLEGRGISN